MGKRKKELSEFGEFLVAEICKTGMSKVDFCTAVGINKPYFYESLAGIPHRRKFSRKCSKCLMQIFLRKIRLNPVTCLTRLLNAGRKYRLISKI